MTDYLLGIATVLALAYLAFGGYLTYNTYSGGQPKHWVHNGPPLAWGWSMKPYIFWPALVVMPVLWPLLTVVFRANHSYNRRKWNRMEPEQRGAARSKWEAGV